MKERIIKEKESNANLLPMMRDENVSYGSEIQLRHFNSEGFFNGKILCSEYDKSAYKFELSTSFSSGMIFRILPKFKIRQEGDLVQFCDQILLYNVKLDCYVNFSAQRAIFLDQPLNLGNFKEPYYQIPFRGIDKESQRFESHLSHYQETTFQLMLFSNDDKKFKRSTHIKGGDLIRLKHTEKSGYLAADRPFVSPYAEAFLRNYNGEYKEEHNSVDCIWEIESYTARLRGNTCKLKQLN